MTNWNDILKNDNMKRVDKPELIRLEIRELLTSAVSLAYESERFNSKPVLNMLPDLLKEIMDEFQEQ